MALNLFVYFVFYGYGTQFIKGIFADGLESVCLFCVLWPSQHFEDLFWVLWLKKNALSDPTNPHG